MIFSDFKRKIKLAKKPLVMGVLNLTPDSFSDGGKFNTLESALKKVEEFEMAGADLIDIGGESTGPGSRFISLDEEIKRVIPILEEIRKITKIPISIDTYKSEIARLALESGADIINDVTALRGDRAMVSVATKYKCPLVMMYSKDNSPRTTVKRKIYKDVMKTIMAFLKERIAYAEIHGVCRSNIILDPGMGQFISSIPKYSFEIMNRLGELSVFGMPILIGISRKSFLMGDMSTRIERGLIASVFAYLNGAAIIRTHDVIQTVEFFKKFK
jgi:dihydropteroate synthase